LFFTIFISVANICHFSEIANTSKAFVYILNSPEQNKRTCTCSLSPTSSNVRIFLRYRKKTRSTENINLKINNFVFDANRTYITTVLTERKELVLNTNPVFNNSEKVCLLITAGNIFFKITFITKNYHFTLNISQDAFAEFRSVILFYFPNSITKYISAADFYQLKRHYRINKIVGLCLLL
jgi:NADH dehydrogenase/NADH:ubiquinone oxidoreductase subunit G